MITMQTILDCDKYNSFYGITTCYLKIEMWNIYVYIIIRFYFLLTQHISKSLNFDSTYTKNMTQLWKKIYYVPRGVVLRKIAKNT